MDYHEKSLGRIAYERHFAGIGSEVVPWNELEAEFVVLWEKTANTVASEVIYRIEEGLKML